MRTRFAFVVAAAVVALGAPLHGQQPAAAPVQAPPVPLAEQARLQAAAQLTPVAPPRRDRAVVSWARRPRFRFGDDVTIDLTARVQSLAWLHDDLIVPGDEPPMADRISLPRRRVGMVGTIGDRIAFQAERDVTHDGVWRDLYVEARLSRALRVRVGQFKVPFSLEQITSAYDLDFIARASAASALAPLRSMGVMARGRVASDAVEYEAAVLRSDHSLQLWRAGHERSLAGRLIVAPLRDGRRRGSKALQLSVATLLGSAPTGREGFAGETVMGTAFFHPMFISGRSRRLSAAAEWNGRHVSARAEALRSTQQRLGQALDGGDLSDLIGSGWYATGTWHAVRGRKRLGSLDLAARLDRLGFGSARRTDEPFLNPRADHVAPVAKDALTLGANLYLSRWVKLQGNAVRETLRDPLRMLPLGPDPLWSAALRLQVVM